MSLPRAVLRGSPLNAQVAPTSGHTCLMLGNEVWLSVPARTREQLVLGSYLHVRDWHCTCIVTAERGGSHCGRDGLRSQPVRSARQSAHNPARHISVFAACGCPSHTCRISG